MIYKSLLQKKHFVSYQGSFTSFLMEILMLYHHGDGNVTNMVSPPLLLLHTVFCTLHFLLVEFSHVREPTPSFNYIGSTTNTDEGCYICSFSDIKSGHNCSPQQSFCLKFIDDSYLLIIIERTTHAKLRSLIMNG